MALTGAAMPANRSLLEGAPWGLLRPMMATRTLVVLVLVLAGASGCASDGRGGDGPGSDPGTPNPTCQPIGGFTTGIDSVGRFDYRVTGGLSGGGDGTSLQIDSSGVFTRHTLQRGTETGRLDPATLQDLTDKARAVQFPSPCIMYGCGGCGDTYVHNVSVQLDAIPYTVQVDELASPPPPVQALLDALKAIVVRPL
jgi:hypothetical protein